MRNFFRKHRCGDHLAHKIARYKGELAAVAHLLEYYGCMRFDVNSVPGCWQHAHKIQMIHELTEEHGQLMKKLNVLQNRAVEAQ